MIDAWEREEFSAHGTHSDSLWKRLCVIWKTTDTFLMEKYTFINLQAKYLFHYGNEHTVDISSSQIYKSHPANSRQVFLFSASRDHRPQTMVNSKGFLPFKKTHSQGWHANHSHNTSWNAVWVAYANSKWLRYPNYWHSRAHKKRQTKRKGLARVKQFLISRNARQSSRFKLPTFNRRPF